MNKLNELSRIPNKHSVLSMCLLHLNIIIIAFKKGIFVVSPFYRCGN